MISLISSCLEISRSIDKEAKSTNRCSFIVDLRYVFILFKAEKLRSHCAELTQIVNDICITFTNVGNASLRG